MPLLPGMYVCVKTRGFPAWVIRMATRSRVNHAFIVADDQGGIIEARPGGVRRGSLAAYAGAYAAADTAEPVTGAQRAVVAAKAESMLGTGYNFPAIAGIGLEDIGWHWRLLMRIARADRDVMCSQLVAACGEAAGLDWLCGKPSPDQVTPADLARRPGVERVRI
ncbi:MAG TPA: hypothetical protein VKV80_20085 [Streptosporangiaceae bacterium]|nr:hypothetical protein [Streptosporangiaceae bacterium]